MAARTLRPKHTEEKYYVYELTAADGAIAYVGKGSGNRLQVQMRRYGLAGRIVKRFKSESAAYRYEIERIAEMNPYMNKCAGGNGSRAARDRRQAWEILIEKIGTRAYAARLLLAFGVADASKVEQIRRVAYGCR